MKNFDVEKRSNDIRMSIMGKHHKYDQDKKYTPTGRLTRIFDCPRSRILDQVLIVGGIDQTLPMLAEVTNLPYRTVRRTIEQLIDLELMKETQKIGAMKTYAFVAEGRVSDYMEKTQLDELKKELERIHADG